ncbi:hypothetical protein CXB51_015620 [Gossypium anomalum]|uniref:Uncharacterized protein n=1 Tax=Gossypium anomalum TaxID=47600 RepID=A0A8J5YIC6_9ROSI|nr:hypothetical protein CXB51_015620 [Gossypium anomalum]
MLKKSFIKFFDLNQRNVANRLPQIRIKEIEYASLYHIQIKEIECNCKMKFKSSKCWNNRSCKERGAHSCYQRARRGFGGEVASAHYSRSTR